MEGDQTTLSKIHDLKAVGFCLWQTKYMNYSVGKPV